MKKLLGMFEKLRPRFTPGGRCARLKPVFDAAENFFFAPKTAVRAAPFARDPLDLKRFMSMVIIALIPCVLAGLYLYGLRVLAVIAVSYAVGGAVEVVVAVVRRETINEGFLVTGLIFPLILPPGLPLWMVGVGVAFGVLVGKELFGGTGRNLFNPAMLGRCFLALGYPKAMAATSWIRPGGGFFGRFFEYVDTTAADAVSAATPLPLAKEGTFEPMANMIGGVIPGSIGETCAAAIVAGGIFLIVTRVANWRPVAGTLLSFVGLGLLLGEVCPEQFNHIWWHLFAGGLLFAAFFMATDPVTCPVTNGGKWMYGALIGALVLLIRNLTGYVEGVTFAVLLGNIAAPLLDEVVIRLRLRRLKHER